MRAGNTLRGVGLFAAALMAATACGSDDSSKSGQSAGGSTGSDGGGQEALKLGYVLPETGDLAYLGPPQIKAAEYARSVINDNGGVLGKQMPKLVGGDEANDAAIASQSADRVLGAGADAIIGAAASGMSLAIIDKVTKSNVVQCSGSNTAPTFTTYKDGGYYFRTAPSDAMQGPVLANLMIQDGHSRIALIGRGDDYGKGLVNATVKALKDAGAQVATTVIYDPKAPNFSATVATAKAANPDAVALVTFEEGKQVIKGLIESGIRADQLYGTDGLRSEELPKLVSPKNAGVLAGMKGTAPASADNPEFIKSLKAFAPDLKGCSTHRRSTTAS
ncbi:ABC transporter substrate-binding protein [Leekyejoonella antrihumi]|uniref:ABC transporter substrate-binding protein n=1 Tax=Leekyejoonella antrihumi TaxID=1660198 RepID=UPI001C97AFB0|nr:ABC transporter substrate-binding protein [Leekyejoonella antrihumi]